MPPWAPGADNAPPRLRGEHPEAKTRRHTAHGSSPLTRGAPENLFHHHAVPRLIPAYAGSTATATEFPDQLWAHPRLRGEHDLVGCEAHRNYGSSPLTRGARRVRIHYHRGWGLIPAYAGSTRESFSSSRRTEAHPRLRGEHFANSGGDALSEGSSPLTRGARRAPELAVVAHRLIPAYAGSTHYLRPPFSISAAHPRLRGEHAPSTGASGMLYGSSPLTRGARAFSESLMARPRLIPAYAGSTGKEPP